MALAWNRNDVGCWADGALGIMHVRQRLACLVANVWNQELWQKYGYSIPAELDGVPSDDGGEEFDALEVLQEFTESGVVWMFDGGDLLLVKDEEAAYSSEDLCSHPDFVS